ncbi:glycosyltransferase [Acinetobacter seifertii]|uniref:glycosyltransferase n=1 Tax=Acinetobacter seifertii TaxID=1530123 RepID=UPI000A301C2A|nr:glycosyltransferase [Acinetobacter seifertii]OUC60285.1 glycosyl transferase 2 [Acinetobacter seifertii]
MSNIKISVCMATYNGEKYIKEQLVSILKQISETDEVIISDDSSVDNTLNIIKSINDSRVKVYRNCFRNVIKNFEFSISKASGDIIFFK